MVQHLAFVRAFALSPTVHVHHLLAASDMSQRRTYFNIGHTSYILSDAVEDASYKQLAV